MSESLKKKTVRGVAWTSLERVTNIGIGFVIGVILARLLTPSDYGLLAMIGVFNAISYAFLDSGFANALVRKPDLTEDDNTTAFCFNIVAGLVLFGILWVIAPWVSDFYDKPILTPLVRAEASLLIISSFRIVQGTQLTRALNFKAKMLVRVTSNVLSGILGVIAAYNGFGVWALVLMHISGSFTGLVMLWVISPWRPRGRWNKASFNYLWGYGSKLLASGMLNTIYNNIYPIIIGKFFSAAELGQYTRANHYANMPSGTLTGVIQQVTFPVLSQIQDENDRLEKSYRRMLRFMVFIIFPVMFGMAALAHPIKKIIGVCVISISVFYGVMGLCWGSLCSALICLFINTYYTGKLINVGFAKQMKDMTPTLLASLAMGTVIYLATMLINGDVLKLAVGIPLGMTFYLAVAKIFRMPELKEALDILHRR